MTTMDDRYPAPLARRIWSDSARGHRMRLVADAYATEAVRGDPDLRDPGDAILQIRRAADPSVFDWRHAELEHGHEVVGFLDAYLARLPVELHPYVHFGLTSSDLTEYDLHQAISEHAAELSKSLFALVETLAVGASKYRELPRAGRTHGQTAEVTTLGHQYQVFYHTLRRINSDLDRVAWEAPIKSPGPTGVGEGVLCPWPTVPSTQILPRDFLLRWAGAYLNLSNTLETMAMFVRTGSRSEIGELREGASAQRQGSSAMPGKRNPIQSEKVCGLARIARGQFLSLAEVSALWEDRDLSNSSTERIAVPGLAATVEHMLATVSVVFSELVVDTDRIRANSTDQRCTMNRLQREIQLTDRVGPIQASRLATEREPA
jgi:adenylosuccinate lyase